MFCKECGAKIENENDKFCVECGLPLRKKNTKKKIEEEIPKETMMYCLSCKTPLPGRPSHCPGCGKSMTYPDENNNLQNSFNTDSSNKMNNKDKLMLIPRIMAGGVGLIVLGVFLLFIWGIIFIVFSIIIGGITGFPTWSFYLSGVLAALTTLGIVEHWMRGG